MVIGGAHSKREPNAHNSFGGERGGRIQLLPHVVKIRNNRHEGGSIKQAQNEIKTYVFNKLGKNSPAIPTRFVPLYKSTT